MKLRPLEYVWLFVALAIVAQQLVVRKGAFDPVAAATIVFFIGLIPAGRVDRPGGNGVGDETPIQRLVRALMGGGGK